DPGPDADEREDTADDEAEVSELLFLVRSFHGHPSSVQLKLFAPVAITGERLLLSLLQHTVLEHEQVELSAHEAPVGVGWCADDRLAAHVERCIHDDATPGLRL